MRFLQTCHSSPAVVWWRGSYELCLDVLIVGGLCLVGKSIGLCLLVVWRAGRLDGELPGLTLIVFFAALVGNA